MINKKISTMFLVILLAAFSFEAWAGPLVWGPKKYIRDTRRPVPIVESFTIANPEGKFWLHIGNGGHIKRPDLRPGAVEPVNQASSAYIKLNGVRVVGPKDLNQHVHGVDKDIALQANNTIEVEVRGKPESYITVDIRRAELNETVANKEGSMSGTNMKDSVHITWGHTERASEYVIYKAYSIDGPWIEWTRFSEDQHPNADDGTSEAEIRDLCYKIEALNSRGKVIKRYKPICVPKWQTEESALSRTVGELSNTGVEPASAGSIPSSSASYNDMCLSDDDFTNTSTMNIEDIKQFLNDKGGFLKEDRVEDVVDGYFFSPTDVIDFAAQTYGINPQVILTILQREHSAVTRKKRYNDLVLKRIMEFGKSSTITDQIIDGTAQMNRDFIRLSFGQPTAGGWQVGVGKNAIDGRKLLVTPANKAVAVLFSYDPEIGRRWDNTSIAGGNALFCKVWNDFGFSKPVDSTWFVQVNGVSTRGRLGIGGDYTYVEKNGQHYYENSYVVNGIYDFYANRWWWYMHFSQPGGTHTIIFEESLPGFSYDIAGQGHFTYVGRVGVGADPIEEPGFFLFRSDTLSPPNPSYSLRWPQTSYQLGVDVWVDVPGGKIYRLATAGEDHSFILSNIGDLYFAGSNTFGQLGIGGAMGATFPFDASLGEAGELPNHYRTSWTKKLNDRKYRWVSIPHPNLLLGRCTWAVGRDGFLYVTGQNGGGIGLGGSDSISTFTQVPGLSNVILAQGGIIMTEDATKYSFYRGDLGGIVFDYEITKPEWAAYMEQVGYPGYTPTDLFRLTAAMDNMAFRYVDLVTDGFDRSPFTYSK